jgi:hypothetical protein
MWSARACDPPSLVPVESLAGFAVGRQDGCHRAELIQWLADTTEDGVRGGQQRECVFSYLMLA